MTREEAITILTRLRQYQYPSEMLAFDMAVEALYKVEEQTHYIFQLEAERDMFRDMVSEEPIEDDVMPLSKAIEIILNIDSSDRLRTEAEGVLVRFALRHSCEDAISRAEAIINLINKNLVGGEEEFYKFRDKQCVTEWFDCLRDCVSTLEAMPSVRPESSWIPCSERLPEEDICNSYLIAWIPANEKVKCGLPHYYQVADWEDGDWTNLDFCGHEEIVILAWMPLPKSYKE